MFSLIDESSRCVKCGLCLAECPTYAIYKNEAYSPRGRIALVEALVKDELSMDAEVDERLDSCLLCRRCEKICPSKVKFGRLMDSARAMTHHYRPYWLKTAINGLANSQSLKVAAAAGKLAPGLTGYSAFFRQQKEKSKDKLLKDYPGKSVSRGKVGLFTGCTGRALEHDSLLAAVALLNHAGYQVHIPDKQACCGALHAHMGLAEKASLLQEAVLQNFEGTGVDAIVGITNGCMAHLVDNIDVDVRITDLFQFLAASSSIDRFEFSPLAASAALHLPCSLKNGIPGAEQAILGLLKKVPELDVEIIGKSSTCCGAAGSYFLSHPDIADRLRAPLVTEAAQLDADYLLSSNIGCSLHLAKGLKNRELKILHPAELLAGQLIA